MNQALPQGLETQCDGAVEAFEKEGWPPSTADEEPFPGREEIALLRQGH